MRKYIVLAQFGATAWPTLMYTHYLVTPSKTGMPMISNVSTSRGKPSYPGSKAGMPSTRQAADTAVLRRQAGNCVKSKGCLQLGATCRFQQLPFYVEGGSRDLSRSHAQNRVRRVQDSCGHGKSIKKNTMTGCRTLPGSLLESGRGLYL